jgi:WD40 repeat protein
VWHSRPDGAIIASGSDNGPARIWDAGTGRQLQELSGHTSAVLSVAFSPEGATIASGSADRSVRIWDADTLSVLLTASLDECPFLTFPVEKWHIDVKET